MKVLVTGGAGFIGRNLVLRLIESKRHEVVVLDNLSVRQTSNCLPPEAEFHFGDFTNRSTMARALQGANVVIHLAALSGVIDSVVDPRPSFEINVAGSFQLLELAREAGVRRFIFASTGGALLGDVTPPISEGMSPAPLSPYGATKLALEGYCSAFTSAYDLACVALRFSNIYGPQSSHKKSVVASFIKNALRQESLVVYGDGTQRRDYLYVGDLVKGIETAIDGNFVGTFQLGSGKPTSLRELISVLNGIIGGRLAVRFEPARRGEVHSTWCDISKATREFGFAAPTSLHEGLRLTWQWFAESSNSWMSDIATFPAD